jgi:hypothetical protein
VNGRERGVQARGVVAVVVGQQDIHRVYGIGGTAS